MSRGKNFKVLAFNNDIKKKKVTPLYLVISDTFLVPG